MTVRIITGDCRDVMKSLTTASVDLVLSDTPYGVTACAWDKCVDGWLDELPRIMKPSASLWCFGSMRFFMERSSDFAKWKYAQDLIWEKHNGSNGFADRFRRVHEHVVQFYRGKWRDVYKNPVHSDDATARCVRRKQKAQHWSKIEPGNFISVDGGPRLMRSVICARSMHGRAIHPTQKPEALLAPIIEYSCPQGWVILDCFGGSGSTGVVAESMGRNAILIEKDRKMAMASCRHLNAQAPLFNSSVVAVESAA